MTSVAPRWRPGGSRSARILWRGIAAGVLALAQAGAGAAEFDCLIEPRQKVSINGPIEALIAKVNVDRGDRVRKGQVLVEFDTSIERANLELARHRAGMRGALDARQVRYDHARVRHGRSEELTAKDFVSRQDFEDSEAEYRLTEAELREARDDTRLAELEAARAEAALQQRLLLSPIDGVVTERLMNPGDVSEFGKDPILRISEIDHLNIEVILPAALYRQVARGDRGIMRPEAPIGGEYEASVDVVDEVIDAASGTFGVRLRLDNRQSAIPAGFRCRVELPRIEPQPLVPVNGLTAGIPR